jgi:hypothetical protein
MESNNIVLSQATNEEIIAEIQRRHGTGKSEPPVCKECGDTGTKLEWYKSGEVFSDKWKCSKCDINELSKGHGKESGVELTEGERKLCSVGVYGDVHYSERAVETILTARLKLGRAK